MNIVVLVKVVPGTTEVKMNKETNTLVREGISQVVNPFDEYAVEEALRLKDKFGGKVIVLNMGAPHMKDILRATIEVGADLVIQVSDRAVAASDTWATSYVLSQALAKIAQDYGSIGLILAGKQAIDGDTAQVGPGVAEKYGVPHVAFVRKVRETDAEGGRMVVERMTEEGYDVVETSLPALITVVKEINTPRMPSLKGKMAAKKAEIPVWSAEDLKLDPGKIGLKGSPTRVWKTFVPERKRSGAVFQGEVKEQVVSLVEHLKELKIV